MKVEVGESLVLSWLRHVKKCQIVQLNWKASPTWDVRNSDITRLLINRLDNLIQEKYGYEVFKKSSPEQLLRQGEIDAIGIYFDENGSQIYAVDVAFHEAGLNYGSRTETVSRVVKKCIRTAMCLLTSFNIPHGNISFCAPKISPGIYSDLMIVLTDVNLVLHEFNLEYDIKIYSGEEFNEEILAPVIELTDKVSDTSELFMRSLQMMNLFTTSTSKKKTRHTKVQPSSPNPFPPSPAIPDKKEY